MAPYSKTTAVLTSGGSDTQIFGNYQNASKSGYKFNDLNRDGIWQQDKEPALPGWTITLTGTDGQGNAVNLSNVTNENGYYEFADLVPGNYVVSEELQSGWAQTAPGGDGTYVIELTSGENETDNNFGNYELGILARTPGFWCTHLEVWDGDRTNDGVWDQLLRDENNEPKDGMAALDILDLDGDSSPIQVNGVTGVILGDTPGNFGVLNEGELFVPLNVTQEVICASNKLINSDQRIKLMRMALATQLNVYNGAAGAEEIIPAAVDWLTGELTYYDGSSGNVDQDNDKVVDLTKDYILGQGFTGDKVRARDDAWQGPASKDSSLGYNTDPTLGNPGGEEIFKMLDAFNNNSGYMGSSSPVLALSEDEQNWATIMNGVAQNVFPNNGAPLGIV
jgi:hypothetical protein